MQSVSLHVITRIGLLIKHAIYATESSRLFYARIFRLTIYFDFFLDLVERVKLWTNEIIPLVSIEIISWSIRRKLLIYVKAQDYTMISLQILILFILFKQLKVNVRFFMINIPCALTHNLLDLVLKSEQESLESFEN